VLIGLLGGLETEVNLGVLMMKRLRVVGSTLRARPVAEKSLVMDALRDRVWPLLASGDIKPIIEAVVPVREADRAHRLIASNDTVGKVIIQIR
jgi:NADPH:quinone reductase-like Zn-dependent oxidoreductase